MRDMYWPGRAQSNAGQPETAAASFTRAAEGWHGADPESNEMVALGRVATSAG